jgi:predicted glutamine amidotransferase
VVKESVRKVQKWYFVTNGQINHNSKTTQKRFKNYQNDTDLLGNGSMIQPLETDRQSIGIFATLRL